MSDVTAREFLVPDLGEGLEDATIVAWHVAVGDSVELNQLLVTVETAKAEVDIPSPFTGALLERRGEPGDVLAVGSLLARIGSADDDADVVAPVREAVLVGYGVDPSEGSRRQRATIVTPTVVGRDRPRAKPPVRKLARTLGVDLATLAPGSGPDGIVTRADVERAGATATATPVVVEPEESERIPVRGIRARIADRMMRSRSSIPDATASVTVDCTALLDARVTLTKAATRRGDATVVTPFALICRLTVAALARHRLLNASFDEDGPAIVVHPRVHLGVAVAAPTGLVVPVVRDAGRRGTLDLAAEMAALADGARDGTLAPAQLMGSTFTISNFGALGLDDGIPIVNHPEAAILGVGAIRLRPAVVDGEVVPRSLATFTCAFDHRVCDGAEIGAFLRDLRHLLEQPVTALLDA